MTKKKWIALILFCVGLICSISVSSFSNSNSVSTGILLAIVMYPINVITLVIGLVILIGKVKENVEIGLFTIITLLIIGNLLFSIYYLI